MSSARFGAIALWTESDPCLQAFRIPESGLELRRAMIEPTLDEIMSQLHARLRVVNDGIHIEDAGSRNGTFVGGHQLTEPGVFYPPEVVRCGRTVFLLVRDITPYEGRKLTVRHRLPVGATLHATCDELDRAILEETSIAIAGPRWVARTLARSYLTARNGGAEIDLKAVTEPLDNVLAIGAATRTVLLEHPATLTPRDLDTLATWLETDVRFITCVRRESELDSLPTEIRRWLAPVTLTIPEPRYDELPSVVHSAVNAGARGATVHATLIEELLLCATADEDHLLRVVGAELKDLVSRGGSKLRGGNLLERLRRVGGAAPRSLRDVHFLHLGNPLV